MKSSQRKSPKSKVENLEIDRRKSGRFLFNEREREREREREKKVQAEGRKKRNLREAESLKRSFSKREKAERKLEENEEKLPQIYRKTAL